MPDGAGLIDCKSQPERLPNESTGLLRHARVRSWACRALLGNGRTLVVLAGLSTRNDVSHWRAALCLDTGGRRNCAKSGHANPSRNHRNGWRHSMGACLTASAEEAGGRRSSNSKPAVAKQTTNMNLKSLT